MQIGNRKTLDAAREALRNQFDAIWIASPTYGERERRASRCAHKLDKPRYDDSPNVRIYPDGMRVHLASWFHANGMRADVIRA